MSRSNTAFPSLAKRALAGHSALGLLASALIYLIALSGALAVVAERWQRWEQPGVAEYETLSPAAVQAAMVATLARERGLPRTEHLFVRLPDDNLPRAVVTSDNRAWYVDATGRPVAREAHSWTEFLLALHINLTMPAPWGMLLVGALGVVLAAITLTGVLALPRIFKDAFRLRARDAGRIARVDWHNRLGAWTLPFALTLALTGAFIGLSLAGVSLLAKAETGGDLEPVYGKIFGDEPPEDKAAAPLADAARALATLRSRFPAVTPTYVVIENPGTRGQVLLLLAEHPRRLIYGESYRFDGTGRYLGRLGLSDSAIGKQAAASTYNLHFGNYAGLPVELAYVVLGLALCAITATGTSLWLDKRRRKGLPTAWLAASWCMVVWGTPLALVGSVWLRWLAGPDAPLAALFWLTLAVGLLLAAVKPEAIADRAVRRSLAVALATTAIAHVLWFRPPQGAVLAIDAVLLGLAAALAVLSRTASARPA